MAFTERFLRTPGVVEIAGRQVKRYHVNVADADIDEGVARAAYAFLPRLLPEPDGQTPPASFAVLHRGAGSAAYLLGYSWVVRHMLAPPRPDLAAYLADTLAEGKIGGAE